jgi:hypothetical protein
MKLEDQVCSMELSKRLKELGVKQESYFIWAKESLIPRLSLMPLDENQLLEPYICSAFTVAELGEISFVMVQSYKSFKDHWECVYDPLEIGFVAKTEADARAKMLIYLLENQLMESPNE